MRRWSFRCFGSDAQGSPHGVQRARVCGVGRPRGRLARMLPQLRGIDRRHAFRLALFGVLSCHRRSIVVDGLGGISVRRESVRS